MMKRIRLGIPKIKGSQPMTKNGVIIKAIDPNSVNTNNFLLIAQIPPRHASIPKSIMSVRIKYGVPGNTKTRSHAILERPPMMLKIAPVILIFC